MRKFAFASNNTAVKYHKFFNPKDNKKTFELKINIYCRPTNKLILHNNSSYFSTALSHSKLKNYLEAMLKVQ